MVELKDRVRSARTQALRTVNTQLIELYWSIGRTILERQEAEGWGERGHGPAGRRPAGGVPRNEGPVPAHGWSRNVLLNMMMNRSMERTGAAPSNFVQRLVAPDSELAQQVAKDPYNFEFLGLSGEVAERDLENALTNRITETLRELGPGFAFVGRQVHSRSTATTYTSTCSYFTSSSAGTWSLN